MIIDRNTAVREAMASSEECRELARTTHRRKFRLEGAAAGNSRLVYLVTAQRLQRRLGGGHRQLSTPPGTHAARAGRA